MSSVWIKGVDGRAGPEEVARRFSGQSREYRHAVTETITEDVELKLKATPTISIDVVPTVPKPESTSKDKTYLGPWSAKTQSRIGEEDGDHLDDVYTQDFSRDENPMRGNWGGRLDFVLSCLGYAVGLGNVWRFPYLCYRNGGGVFLIPYSIMLIFVGIPIFFLEVSLGQFSGSASAQCWKFSPFFTGLSLAMVLISGMFALYYNVIIAWSMYYIFASFQHPLPWLACPEHESSDLCMLKVPDMNSSYCGQMNFSISNLDGYCYNETNGKPAGLWNSTLARSVGRTRTLPAEDYLRYVALGSAHSSGLSDMGQLHWSISLCYLLTWVLCYLCMFKGIKATGKVVYFTALFPYIVILILLINGLTLDGAVDGIKFYLKPDISKLADGKVWKDAAVQIFFSLSAAEGGLITFASYNRFHNDVLRDTLIVTIGNGLTSFLAGFVIFSYLGYLANQLGTDVADVASEGTALVFAVYPMAVSSLPFPPFWSVLFFFMLVLIGLDSEFGMVETVLSSILDTWPYLRFKRKMVLLVLAIAMYLIGLPMCTDGGEYLLAWLDNYAGGWNIMTVALMECIAIAWVYGYDRFRRDIACMIGQHYCGCFQWWVVSNWWCLCWGIFTPALLIFALIFSWTSTKPLKNGDHVFERWTEIPGYLLLMSTICLAFGPGFYYVYKAKGTLRERLRQVLRPAADWGPALVNHRKLVARYIPNFTVDPWASDDDDDENDWRREFAFSTPVHNQPSSVGGNGTISRAVSYTPSADIAGNQILPESDVVIKEHDETDDTVQPIATSLITNAIASTTSARDAITEAAGTIGYGNLPQESVTFDATVASNTLIHQGSSINDPGISKNSDSPKISVIDVERTTRVSTTELLTTETLNVIETYI